MPDTDSSGWQAADDVVGDLLDRALRGEAIDADALLASTPGLDDAERERLRAMAADLAPGEQRESGDLAPAKPEAPTVADAAAANNDRFGPYEIVRELGRGAQGTVYLARDTRLARRVALKVLNRGDLLALHDSSQSGPAARLKREAEIASKLDHPGICVVYEMGVETGRPFIAMRYVEGETLARRIAAAREGRHALRCAPESPGGADGSGASTSRREIARVIELVERIARTLDAAHQTHVVHRDLKPGNVMITPTGEPVVLDFGLARDVESDAATLTATGEMIGSPAYMAPEQVDPRRGTIDARTDVYALGVLLYECLTLKRPFDSPTREGLYRAILTAPPPDPREVEPAVSRDLAIVIATALEKDRDRRYRTALDLAEDLRRVRAHEPILARPAGPGLRLRRWTQRSPGTAASIAGAFLVLVSIIIGLNVQARRSEAQNLLLSSVAVLPTDPAASLKRALEFADSGFATDEQVSERLVAGMLALHEVRVLRAHVGQVTGLQSSEDGRTLVTCGDDLTVRIWDGVTWELRRELPRFAGAPRISLSADGEWLAVASDADATRLWATHTGDSRALALEDRRGSPAIAPRGDRLAYAMGDRVEILDLASASPGNPTRIPHPASGTLKWSPGGDWILVPRNGATSLWRVDPPGASFESPCGGVDTPNGGFSSADTNLAVLPSERGFVVFDLERGSVRNEIELTHARASRHPLYARIDPGGSRVLIVYAGGGGGDIFDARDGALIASLTINGVILDGDFSADGSLVLIRLPSNPAGVVCDSASGEVVAELASSDGCNAPVWQAGAAPARCLTFHRSGAVRNWSLDSRLPRARAVVGEGRPSGADGCEARGNRLVVAIESEATVYSLAPLAPLGSLKGHEAPVNWVDISADGRWIATASSDGTARIWSTDDSSEPMWTRPHEKPLWVAEFSPDSRWLATAGEAGCIELFDFQSGEPAIEIFSNGRGIRCLRFDSTGRKLVSVSEMDGWVRVFDLTSREEIASYPPGKNDEPTRRNGSPHSACFHPDGNRVAITTFGGRVLVWDLRDGKVAEAALQDGAKSMDVEFSPDGRLLAVCGPGHAAQLLSADGSKKVAMLPCQGAVPHSLCFAGDGRELVTLDSTNVLRVWPVDITASARDALRSLDPVGLAAR